MFLSAFVLRQTAFRNNIIFNPTQNKPVDIKSIKQVVDLMKESELTEFELEDAGLKLRIKRGNSGEPTIMHSMAPQAYVAPQLAPSSPVATQEKSAQSDASHKLITSPMVGTFYTSASPDSPKYVNVGTQVSSDTVVCIIEAMKVMNEIQAEISGEIIEILVQNEQTVEYGQPLFKVKTA